MEALISMGMDEEASRVALAMSEGNVEMALELLLSGAIGGGDAPPHPPALHPTMPPLPPPFVPDDERIEVCAVSQYSFGGGGGESSCTLISLLAALEFLPPQVGPSSSLPLSVSAAQYEGVIGRGAAMASQGQAHLSAEEVLPRMTGLKQNGSVLSTLITTSGAYETLMESAVAAASSATPVNTYCSIVLTKPPESVCLLVPLVPPTIERPYILLDSHARPQLGLSGAYIVTTPSKESICRRLRLLFPPFPLPADELDEYQQLMYNGLDGTVVSRV